MAAAVLACSCGLAAGAGGHHAVDEAEIAEPGQCGLESWAERSSGSGRLLHLGLECRVGPVELAAATEPQRQDGASTSEHALQVKWAREFAPGLRAGVSAGPKWQAHARPRFQGTQAAALLTWSAREDLRLHANLGRDFVHRGGDEPRHGVAVDWTPGGGAWQLAAERYREEGGHFARVGLRWTAAPHWTVDVSRAQHLRGAGASSWTLGLQRAFDR